MSLLCSPREKCGVFGIYSPQRSQDPQILKIGLIFLQHRGQESAGITVSDFERVMTVKGMGLVASVLEDISRIFPFRIGIGHTRYSTAGSSAPESAQPIVVKTKWGELSIVHNGNLVNFSELRQELMKNGHVFQSDADSEVFLHLMNISSSNDPVDALVDAISKVKGSFSVLIASRDFLMVARDRFGIRPLFYGRGPCGELAFSSETVSFDVIGYETVGEFPPGQIWVLQEGRFEKVQYAEPLKRFCSFEAVYFSRPDSLFKVGGGRVNFYTVRKEFGKRLAKEAPVDADVVVPLPDSGTPAAVGFSEISGIPLEMLLVRNRYSGRTFIQPTQVTRRIGVRIKFNPVSQEIKGKRVVLVDDSIVRGTTITQVVRMMRRAGAREVHVRVASPPVKFPCFYGIDMPTFEELVASGDSFVDVGADSLVYLSYEGFREVLLGLYGEYAFCDACFSGNYPVEVPAISFVERKKKD